MVEEIRSYLLNSREYGAYSYFPEDYSVKKISSVEAQFRSTILGTDYTSDKSVHVWRANKLISGIYRDRQLSSMAYELFDHRVLPDRKDTVENFNIVFSVKNYQPSSSQNYKLNILATANVLPVNGIIQKRIVLKTSPNVGQIYADIYDANGSTTKELNFSFSQDSSNFVSILGTPIRVSFSGTSSIPNPFFNTEIMLNYPNYLNINDLIVKVQEISGLDQLLWTNKTVNSNILPLYNSCSRQHQRLLCNLMAYAVNLKES